MSITGSSLGYVRKVDRSTCACTSSSQSVGGVAAPSRTDPNISTRADLVQHSCRPTSAPMLNRYILFYSSFSSSFFYIFMGSGTRRCCPSATVPSSFFYIFLGSGTRRPSAQCPLTPSFSSSDFQTPQPRLLAGGFLVASKADRQS